MKRVYRVRERLDQGAHYITADGALNVRPVLAAALDVAVEDLDIIEVADVTDELMSPTQSTKTIRSLLAILNLAQDTIITKIHGENDPYDRKAEWIVVEEMDDGDDHLMAYEDELSQ